MYQDINRNMRQLYSFSPFSLCLCSFSVEKEYSEIIPGQKIGPDGFIGEDYHISKYPLPQAGADPRVQR